MMIITGGLIITGGMVINQRDEAFTGYSNFNAYIIDGVRQSSTGALVRINVSITQRFIVTSTVTVTGFKFIRIPPDNWSGISGYAVTGTLSVVSGSGGTIDGGSGNKSFNTKSTVNITTVPATRANTTSQYDTYDVRPTNNSLTVLTAGQYNMTLLGTGANMLLALLTTSAFPIDTSRKIYPNNAIATHLALEVF